MLQTRAITAAVARELTAPYLLSEPIQEKRKRGKS